MEVYILLFLYALLRAQHFHIVKPLLLCFFGRGLTTECFLSLVLKALLGVFLVRIKISFQDGFLTRSYDFLAEY